MQYPDTFDVIVIGGGHAGTEAALAAARMGAQTLLLTQSIETIGQMSCNPAIGGIGKSHLVKEIDALDGAMARATDQAGIQFRVLNGRKGPAVQATRAQADRTLYKAAIRRIVENQPNLRLFQQAVDGLICDGDRITGVVTQTGLRFSTRTVVLTAGTFLAGKIHIGLQNHVGGRAGDPASVALSNDLRSRPFRVGRLKTGTPPRIDGRTVDFSKMEEQPGDTPLPVMSFLGNVAEHPRQVSCFITHTSEQTHDIVRASLDQSPMYAGVIEGVGPRYCPSLEDKVVRFANRAAHQIFVEPEGLESTELYPNGISTSLPFDVQLRIVRSISGFEHAHITRPGYAIEYDYFDPRDLQRSLETQLIEGLFFAGQINGTTGYEEAAAQGLVAGINAALKVANRPAWCPTRADGYLGVLIDDLTTHGTSEPYRMFTSRAEYRLLLRQDNADLRLTAMGRELGVVGDARWQAFSHKQAALEAARSMLQTTRVHPNSELGVAIAAHMQQPLARDISLYELLRRPEITANMLAALVPNWPVDPAVAEQLETQIKYEGYIQRQQGDVDRLRREEDMTLPGDLDYAEVGSLSNEVRQKLMRSRPETLARAARIPGVTQAALSILMIHLKKKREATG